MLALLAKLENGGTRVNRFLSFCLSRQSRGFKFRVRIPIKSNHNDKVLEISEAFKLLILKYNCQDQFKVVVEAFKICRCCRKRDPTYS